jgi:hypothetical protein
LFEGQVGAYYLLSMLAGGEPRGLPGTIIVQIEFQRASERPLDDVTIKATDHRGDQAILEVQVKRTINFTASDPVFQALVVQIAKAAAKPQFDNQRYELAVATERTSTKIERSYQEVLSWARELGTAETFFIRLNQARLANTDMRKFVENFRANLKSAGAAHDNVSVWRILRRFQILVFDFNQEGSATEILVRDRCRMLLAPEEVEKANPLWQSLVTLTLESAAKGGEKTAAQLRETLVNEYHYRFAAERQLTNARAALQEASLGALGDIFNTVGRTHVDRAVHVAGFYASLDKGRYIEIRGAPGVGKSGVLKHLAELISSEARVIVLNAARTLPHGWVSLRATLGCNVSAHEFLADLAGDGAAILFIDGLDNFDDEDRKTTVRDLVHAAAQVPSFSVVVSARSDFGRDGAFWLPQDALNDLGRAPAVIVNELNADEIGQLSDADPSLAYLLADKHPAREVTRNLFRLARLAARSAETPVPPSEAVMAQQWWQTGDGGDAGRRERTRLLHRLAEQSLKSSGPFDTRSENSAAVEALIKSATLRELKPELVVFHHDVLRDWAVACLLHDEPAFIDQLPLSGPAPETLARGLEIAARLAVETSPDDAQWVALLKRLSQVGMHGSWRRAVLLALVRSEIGFPVLDRTSKTLTADRGEVLKELLRVTFAVDSELGAQAYASIGIDIPSLPADFFIPAAPSWLRLILWTHTRINDLPNEIIPDLANLYSKWSMAMFGQDLITPLLLAHVYEWLIEMESALHPVHYSDLRRPFGLSMPLENERELETNLRLNFLASCWRVPELADRYLRSVVARARGDAIADEIMKFRGTASQAAPASLADLTLRTLIPARRENIGFPRLDHGPFDIDDSSYFPPSPNQGPMLELLTHAPEQGLRVVRGLIAHAVHHYGGDRDPGDNVIVIRFAGCERTFAWQNCYNWSRSSNSSIATSALMALEAWGHKHIEDGKAPDAVLNSILGTGVVPTAFLLVAVDLLISHWPKTAYDAIPFLASPGLLSIDRERYAHDTMPPFNPTAKEPHGLSSLKNLQNRPSRRLSLDTLIGQYVYRESPHLPQLQVALSESASRVGPPGEGDDNMRSLRFAAFHAINLADPSNWKHAEMDRGDGTLIPVVQYQAPEAEATLVAPGQARFSARSTETEMHAALPLALDDRSSSTPEFLSRGAAWAQALDLTAKDPEAAEDIFHREDWRIRARITVAALIARDGDEGTRQQHEPWARQILAETFRAGSDPHGGHPLLAFNNIAIAAVGQISAVRRAPTAPGVRSLLEIAARSDYAMLPAFAAEISALLQIDLRLPRAVMRIAFAACIQARHNYEESEAENALRRQAHRERVIASIEREMYWLCDGGAEPDWPVFPSDAPRRRRTSRIRVPEEVGDEERSRRSNAVASGEAAKWLQAALPLLGNETMGWFRALLDSYAEWTSIENGAGQEDDFEVSLDPLEWNMTYFDLVPRTFVGMSQDDIDRGSLQRVLTFPDDSFCETVAVMVRTLDELYFNGKILEAEEALRLRTLLFEEMRRRRGWRRILERRSTSMEMHFARAVSSLFLHNESWGGGGCYINPVGADNLRVFMPLLSRICVEAAQSQYIAFQFLDLLALKINVGNLGFLVTAASAWMVNYPEDTSFWIEHGVGKRICAWLAEAMNAAAGAFSAPSCPATEIDRLLDNLLRLGVAAARQVEQTFTRIRPPAN